MRQAPEGVYLTEIKQTGQVVAVRGVAQTNERVSEFLRNTLYSSPWLEKPELVEIKAVAQCRTAPATSAGCSTSRCASRSNARKAAAGCSGSGVGRTRCIGPAAAAPMPNQADPAMAKASTLNFDVSSLLDQAAGQFRNLNPTSPASGRLLPKLAAGSPPRLAVVGLGWFFLLSASSDRRTAAARRSPR